MQKQIITSIIVILSLISIISAFDITAGEPYTFPIDEEYDYWSMVGNSTDIDLNVTLDGLNVTITTGKYTQEDSFTLIFFNKEKEIITKVEHHYSSGGSGGTRTVYKDRNVTEYILLEGEEKIITETDTVTETITESKTPIWAWVVVGVSILLVVIWIIKVAGNSE